MPVSGCDLCLSVDKTYSLVLVVVVVVVVVVTHFDFVYYLFYVNHFEECFGVCCCWFYLSNLKEFAPSFVVTFVFCTEYCQE
jgi:hypothetical protein